MIPGWFDQGRFEQEWAADQGVLARLAEQGDKADQLRDLDVSFTGNESNLRDAEQEAANYGFRIIQIVKVEGGVWRLDVSRQQSANAETIRQLTIDALQIEAACSVSYDGWGCITQNDRA